MAHEDEERSNKDKFVLCIDKYYHNDIRKQKDTYIHTHTYVYTHIHYQPKVQTHLSADTSLCRHFLLCHDFCTIQLMVSTTLRQEIPQTNPDEVTPVK